MATVLLGFPTDTPLDSITSHFDVGVKSSSLSAFGTPVADVSSLQFWLSSDVFCLDRCFCFLPLFTTFSLSGGECIGLSKSLLAAGGASAVVSLL